MSDTPEAIISAQQKVVRDIKASIADAEDMLHATADQAGDKIAKVRARIQERLHSARVSLREAEATLMAKTRAAAQATDAYVHESPWTAVGVAAAAGLLIGVMISRR